MANSNQTYKNHTRWVPPFHFFVLPVLLVNWVNTVRHLVQAPSLHTTWEVVLAMALMMLAALCRNMAVTVQDRVIRMEMRTRLRQLLPPDLQPRINELTPRQLVSMRFASDEEMPELAREVLAGNLPSSKAIKLRVKHWQGDYLRA